MQFKPDADGHIFLLWPDEVRHLAQECNLEIDEQVFFTTFFTAGYVKTARMLRILPRSAVFALESVIAHLPDVVKERLMVHTAVRLRKPTWPLGKAVPAEQLAGSTAQLLENRPRDDPSRAICDRFGLPGFAAQLSRLAAFFTPAGRRVPVLDGRVQASSGLVAFGGFHKARTRGAHDAGG